MEDYVSPSSLNDSIGEEYRSSLKCIHLNLRSARNKIPDVELFFSQFNFSFDVIIFPETWHQNNVDVLSFQSHKSFYLNRHTRHGEATSIMVRNNIECESLPDFRCTTDDYRALALRTSRTIYAVFYRPPNGNCEYFLNYLKNCFFFCSE